ncbi:MAG: ribosomal protein S18-alanine N-acetyltransferase [Chloroflexi bacterium]|nr:ribosomal protein S18-alanine N-acetyltransferase [Chloroflexota bacterium]
MKINVRRMQTADVPSVVRIDRMSMTVPWPARVYEREVTTAHTRAWVAEAGAEVIGMLVLWIIVDEAHIATVAVHPQYRRRGVSEALVRTALQEAANEGAVTALLEVRAGNIAAQNLYRKIGFEAVGRRRGYYKDNGEDAILMTLEHLSIETLAHASA